MKWNSQTRRYETAQGKPVPAKQIRDDVDAFIEDQKREVDKQSKLMLAGLLSVPLFFKWLKDKITAMHGIAGTIAYGGESEMTPERWARIGEKLSSETAYLENFERQTLLAQQRTQLLAADVARTADRVAAVPSGLDSLIESRVIEAVMQSDAAGRTVAVEDAIQGALADSIGTAEAESIAAEVARDVLESRNLDEMIWGAVESRSRQYLDSVYGQYENSVKAREGDAGAVGVRRVCEDDAASCDECIAAATDEYVAMDEILDIGDATCGGNCRCSFEFEFLGVEPLEIEREIYA